MCFVNTEALRSLVAANGQTVETDVDVRHKTDVQGKVCKTCTIRGKVRYNSS